MLPRVLRLALVAALAAAAAAAPTIQDVAETTVDIAVPRPEEPDAVAVTVQRVDELIDDTNGDVLAARIVDVNLRFDVPPTGDGILVNDVPTPLGVSSVDVATTIVASTSIADVLPPEIIGAAFDVGLATVDVDASEEVLTLARTDLVADPASVMSPSDLAALPDFLVVRRINIKVHVTAVNTVSVEQIDIVEQVMDVIGSGYVLRSTPVTSPASTDPDVMAAMQARRDAHRAHCLRHHRMAALWQRLPHGTRVALAAFFGSLLLLVVFVALPLAAYVHWKERQAGYSVIMDGKLHAAVSTQLPTIDEEDEGDEADADASPSREVDEKAWLRANQAPSPSSL